MRCFFCGRVMNKFNILNIMEDPNILDISGGNFLKLCLFLSDRNTLDTFLEVIPPEYCSMDLLTKMELEGQKPNMSPAKVLLFHLGSRDVHVSKLVRWLETANLEKALLWLKNDEPIKIVLQPIPYLSIQEGSLLTLTCKATSFPTPEYQWFKGNDELVHQQESSLLIRCASLEDSGLYICRIVSINCVTGNVTCLFSHETRVEIVSTLLQPKTQNFGACRNAESMIKIVKHPIGPGKIAQGSSVFLNCEAVSNDSVCYKWFCNGKIIQGEISSELKLKDLVPDPDTGEKKWEYQCQVYNEFGTAVLSHIAIVELDTADVFYAEEKLAFLLANDTYENLEELKSPGNDAATLAHKLSSMNFKIFALKNLNLTEMMNALHLFCKTLKPNVYVVFYFAGHGFDLCGQTYLQPVDCSNSCNPKESLCVQHVLECIQEANPAMAVMLIDSCRKLPSENKTLTSGKIFVPNTGRNTIYCYSTSFSKGSHESDEEPNGFFIKYLKKYINQEKDIHEIFRMVQADFKHDPLVKDLQFPWVSGSLSELRKLCDPIIEKKESLFDKTLFWADTKSTVCKDISYCMKSIGVSIHLEFHHHMNAFCNGIDVNSYLVVEQSDKLEVVRNLEVDMRFITDQIQVINTPIVKAVYRQDHRNLLFKKQILSIQKMQGILDCEILLFSGSTNELLRTLQCTLDIGQIAELKLSLKELQSSNSENNGEKNDLNMHSFSDNDGETTLSSIEENESISSYFLSNK